MKKILNWFLKNINNISYKLNIQVPQAPEGFIAKKYNYFETRDLYERVAGFKKDELGTTYRLYRDYDGGCQISEKRFIRYLTETMIDYRKELKIYYPNIDKEYFDWIKNGKGEL